MKTTGRWATDWCMCVLLLEQIMFIKKYELFCMTTRPGGYARSTSSIKSHLYFGLGKAAPQCAGPSESWAITVIAELMPSATSTCSFTPIGS